MARQKRTSAILENARTRAAGLSGIAATVDLGNGLTLAAYSAQIDALTAEIAAYNAKLAELDGMTNELKAAEKSLGELSARMLAAVAVKYGRDSSEYEKAGGVRFSERKRPVRKAGAAAPGG